MQTLKANGTLCLVGAPPGQIEFPASLLAQRSVCGSDVEPCGITAMLEFSARHRIGAQIETAPMGEVNRALDRLRRNEVRYRMVLVNS